MREAERLTRQRLMMRKMRDLARAMLHECEAAEREPLTPDTADRREIALACLFRRAAVLELQVRRAHQDAADAARDRLLRG